MARVIAVAGADDDGRRKPTWLRTRGELSGPGGSADFQFKTSRQARENGRTCPPFGGPAHRQPASAPRRGRKHGGGR